MDEFLQAPSRSLVPSPSERWALVRRYYEPLAVATYSPHKTTRLSNSSQNRLGYSGDILSSSHLELNTSTSQNAWICYVWMRFQFKEVAEQNDGRGDAKESFAEMDEN